MKSGVDCLNLSKNLQKFRYIHSRMEKRENPQISHPFNRIGWILSNNSRWHCIDRLCSLPLFKPSHNAFVALSVSFWFYLVWHLDKLLHAFQWFIIITKMQFSCQSSISKFIHFLFINSSFCNRYENCLTEFFRKLCYQHSVICT